MKSLTGILIWSLLLITGTDTVCAQTMAPDQDLGAALRKVIVENLDAYEKEDLARVLATVHTQALGYLATKQATLEMFSEFDLHYELLEFRFLSLDGEYAMVRAKQKTMKVNGPAFRDSIVETVIIFKQEEGRWKFWTQAILDVQILN